MLRSYTGADLLTIGLRGRGVTLQEAGEPRAGSLYLRFRAGPEFRVGGFHDLAFRPLRLSVGDGKERVGNPRWVLAHSASARTLVRNRLLVERIDRVEELVEQRVHHFADEPGADALLSAEIAGRIDRLPRAGLSLKTPAVAAGPLAVLSFPEYDDIEAVLGNPVHPFVVLLDPDAANGFERNWAPAEDRADRSLAYAVQWFGLAALALALAIGTAVRSLRRNAGSKP
jgi:hypothetical protein